MFEEGNATQMNLVNQRGGGADMMSKVKRMLDNRGHGEHGTVML